jgi:S1-C subfamily serine protease
MRQPIQYTIIAIIALALSACALQVIQPVGQQLKSSAVKSVIRVTVTSQGYQFHRPWQQRRPTTQTGIGAIVPGGQVLVTASLVANHRFIELESIDTKTKYRAAVAVVDYEANLALLKPLDDNFMQGRVPLEITSPISQGDSLTIWQVKPNGNIIPTTGRVTSIELRAYTKGNYFLTYRVNSALQYGANNLTLPVVRGTKLAGFMLRNDTSGQTIDIIATQVIRHFLKDAKKPNYQGFPRAGFHYGPMIDPQLRRYIGLREDISGIYVQKVIKGGPAAIAGMTSQDVITRIGDFAVSNTGQYDHPLYGKTSIAHLIRTVYHAGDKVPFQVYRKGKLVTLNIQLNHRKPDEYLVPPYVVDRQPKYLIVGGLIFQELSVSYLREYGKDWASRAPIDLVYYQQNQDYLNGDGREKIIIISKVIQTPFTIGYGNLGDLVVKRVNGQTIHKLADVATAVKTPQGGFHKIEVEQTPGILYLDPKEVPLIHQIIRERYRIPIPSMDSLQ